MYMCLSRHALRRRPPSPRALVAAVFALVMLSGVAAEGAEAASGVLNSPGEKNQSLVPPPRTISDIIAILDAQKLDQVERPRMKRHIKRANSKPPKDAGRTELARFYLKRGRSARRIGRVRQVLDDLTKANALGADLPPKHRHRILRLLAIAEVSSGDQAKGIQHLRQAIEVTESETKKIDDTARLLRFLGVYGSLEEKKRLLADAARRMDLMRHATEGRSARQWRRFGEKIQGSVARARGKFLWKTGRLVESEAAYRSAFTHFSRYMATSKRSARKGRILRNHAQANLGGILNLQGRHKEAEVEARKALLDVLQSHGRYNRWTATRTFSLARILRAQGRPLEAETLLRASLEIYGKIGTEEGSKNTTRTRAALADTLADQGRWAEALGQFDTIKAASAHDPVRLEQRILTNPSYALALIRNGRPSEALAIARRAVARQLRLVGKDNRQSAGAQGILAMALEALGRDREALEAFSRATPRLLTVDTNQSRGVQNWRTKLVLESHMALLARLGGPALVAEPGFEPTAEAFRIAEALRGQGVQRALNASAARASAGSPGLAKLVRREQDTANRLGALTALYADVLSQPTSQQDPNAQKTLPATIARLRHEHKALTAQIAK
ncbi:MAG: tetratricopeptide repeat protein, partial [Alphaproteobacteria bacterium]